tara:strand:+ start:128 stop:751 length:624 start_codon:yes stop_codon:yes gene_type:complete
MIWFSTIQKTGSSSLRSVLKHPDYFNKARFHEHGYFFNPWTNNEDSIKLWYQFGWKPPLLDNKMTDKDDFIAIVRNPFDIFVSYYEHQDRKGWGNVNIALDIKSFEQFFEYYTNPEITWHLPPMKKSMFSFIYDKDDNLMITDYYKLEEINKLNLFLNSIDLPSLEVSNVTKNKKDYRTYYTPDMVSKLKEIWKKDLEYFKYDIDIT